MATTAPEGTRIESLASRVGALKLAIPGMLLAVACLLPYLNKAYTIDDPTFLQSARQILRSPLQPMSFPRCWEDHEVCVESVAKVGAGSSEALMGYLLVPVMLAGGAEWMAHLLQILLACVAVLGMVRLALRLGLDRVQSAGAGLMLAAIPPFLPMASTAMPDVAALALGLTGLERLLAWKERQRWRAGLIASLSLGLAPYARPHFVLLIPLGALWLLCGFRFREVMRQARREAYLWMPLLAAASILLAVNIVTRDRGPAGEARNLLAGLKYVPLNLRSYLLYLTFPIPFAAVWLARHARRWPMLLVLPAVPALVSHFELPQGTSLAREWPTVAVLYGLAALGFMLYRCVREQDRIGLLLSLWVLIPAPVVIYDQFPIKYLLAAMPAIILILVRALSTLPRRRELAVYSAIVLACTAYSCVILRADADDAEYGRRAAGELIAPRVAAGERVWFSGQLGFYWYAQQAGATVTNPSKPGPNPGELLALGLVESGQVARDRFPNRELVDSRHYDSPHGRTNLHGGGLYCNGCGDALWVWNPKATNDYELWRIR